MDGARLSRNMSLRAKIEAVIYAAEEPVTLAQLAAIFADELAPQPPELPAHPVAERQADEPRPGVASLLGRGFLQAEHAAEPDTEIAEVALLTGLEEQAPQEQAAPDPAAAEAEAKRVARQRERQLREQIKAVVDGLVQEYAESDRGMEIREVAGGYRIATKPEYHDAVRAFVKSLKPPMKLSLQALETLAVIAYKQPVTAPEVGEIRGVDSGGVLGGLISRKLVTTAGRKQVIGRPILYKTTREFLLRFGLKDLNELPSIEEFEKLAGDIEIGEEETTPEESSLPFDAKSDTASPEADSTEEGAPSYAAVSRRVGGADLPEEGPANEPISIEEHHG
jgi:segregation and condensation protein B